MPLRYLSSIFIEEIKDILLPCLSKSCSPSPSAEIIVRIFNVESSLNS